MRILFYVGYQANPLGPNTNQGIGGTEVAVRKLAREMANFGYKVCISGQVEDLGVVDNVEWISTEQVHQKYFDQFDIIVSASYIHFMVEFENYSAKKIFWAHNTHHHPWFRGELLPNADELARQVDLTVCLTQWHARQWARAYGIPLDKIAIIGNGIETASFFGQPQKRKNQFIWSSAPERGLEDLLDHWPQIRESVLEATLEIYFPDYAKSQVEDLMPKINQLDGVTVKGTVDQATLHNAMLKSDYWCYMTDYEETYCITALEMQYARVLPITTTKAALAETVHGGIILPDNSETNWKNAIQSLKVMGSELKDKALDTNHVWAKRQTWAQRSYNWKQIFEVVNETITV